MTPTRSRRRPEALALATAAALALAACSPSAPPGVNQDQLDAEVSNAIGDPATCLLIGRAGSDKLLYRYNTATVCDRLLDACSGGARMKVGDLLAATAKDRAAHLSSCYTDADHSRSVGWASGPIAGTDMVYAAAMEGTRAFPGRMMADRLQTAFANAKVSKPAP